MRVGVGFELVHGQPMDPITGMALYSELHRLGTLTREGVVADLGEESQKRRATSSKRRMQLLVRVASRQVNR